MYNEYLDELEYADQVGFDGICVNEHHQNAYGLMPSPNIMAATLTRRTTNAKLVVMGNSVALYNPPMRVAEEFAMLDVPLRRAARRRVPGGHADGHVLLLRREPGHAAREVPRRRRARAARRGSNPRRLHVQRQVHPAPLRQHVAAPVQQPHPPVWIPGGGSVETWEWCADNDFLYAYLSYFGYLRGPAGHGRLLGGVERHGRRPQPVPGRLPAVRRRRRRRRPGGGAVRRGRARTSTTAACTSTRASPTRPATPASPRSEGASPPRCRRPRSCGPRT